MYTTTPGPSSAIAGSFLEPVQKQLGEVPERHFFIQKIPSTFGDTCQQNDSENDLTTPRTRETSLLTTYWSKSTESSRCF